MKELVLGVLTNLPFISALIAMLLAQSIKVLYYLIVEGQLNFARFVEQGGMPSSHSAMVAGLTTMVGLTSGWNSVWFAISCIFSIVVMYDAAGIRRAAGKQAIILNKIVEDIYATGKISNERLQELLGHTPLEVLVGAILGVICSLMIYLTVI